MTTRCAARSQNPPPEYLTTREAAALLRISLRTLARHVRSGRVQVLRLGRRALYRPDDLRGALVRP